MIKLLTTHGCGGCDRAKMLLSMAEIPYRAYSVEQTHELEVINMQSFMKANGLRSLPQIFDGATYIGTDKDLPKYIKENS